MNIQTSQDYHPSPLVAFWNEILAPKLIKHQHILVGGSKRHSAQVLNALGIKSGDAVLDVGCGFGDTTIDLANLAAPSGHAVGVDCCQSFLDQAWQRAELGWIPNVRFECRDIETDRPDEQFDFVFARFGTQFFSNPVAGLRSIRYCMKPGARMAHMVWRNRADNPWLTASRDVVQTILPKPGEDALTCGPGPFSMADEDLVRAQMKAAGFADIAFERVDAKIMVGRTVNEAIDFQLAIGPAGETFREAGALGEARRDKVNAALEQMFSTVDHDDEGLWMDSSSWLITARNPAFD